MNMVYPVVFVVLAWSALLPIFFPNNKLFILWQMIGFTTLSVSYQCVKTTAVTRATLSLQSHLLLML